MSLANFCAAKLSPQNIGGMKFNIVNYCKAQSKINTLTNKKINNVNTQFNTSYNDTSISRSMRYSQLVRNGGGTTVIFNPSNSNTFGVGLGPQNQSYIGAGVKILGQNNTPCFPK